MGVIDSNKSMTSATGRVLFSHPVQVSRCAGRFPIKRCEPRGAPNESTAGWHGLTAWALTSLVIFYLLTSAVGSIVGGAYSTLTSAVGNVASTFGGAAQTAAQTAAPGLAQASHPFSSIAQSLRGATGGNDPAALRDAATVAVRAALTGDQAPAQEARDRAAKAIAKAEIFLWSRLALRCSSMSSSTGRLSITPSRKQPKLPMLPPRLCRAAPCSARSLSF
jgi:hypothetical protein